MQKNFFVSEKVRKREFKVQLILFFAIMMMLLTPMQNVYAYSSWVTNPAADNMYGELEAQDKVSEMDNSEEDAHSHILLNFLIKIPDGITNALQGSSNSDYNFSIDGIILGRLASGTTVNYTGFDFGNNNPWSSIGAVIYQCLRGVCLGGMMFVFMWILTKNMVMTGEKARTNLKEYVSTLIFMFVLIYAMPQILDIIIYWRDQVLSLIHTSLQTSGIASSSSTSIIEEYRNIAVTEMNTFNVLLYAGASISTLWYLLSYLKIAIIQTMLFGIFPLIAVLGIHNRKMVNDWFWMFIGNVMTPILDFVILLMPIVVDNTISTNQLLKALIKLSIIISAIPARNAVLRLISNQSGTSVGGGFGALGMLGGAMLGTGRTMLSGARTATGSLANRESDLDNHSSLDTPELATNFGNDTKAMENLPGLADGDDGERSFAGAEASINNEDQQDENISAFEQSQEAVAEQISDGEEEDYDRTGYTDDMEPDVTGISNATESEDGIGVDYDRTGYTDDMEPDINAISANELGESSGIITSKENFAESGMEDSQYTGDGQVGLGENVTTETGSTLNGGNNDSNVPETTTQHSVNDTAVDKDVDMTGTPNKTIQAEYDSDSASVRTNDTFKQEYNEPENLGNFNDLRFRNLENLDAATERLGGLKAEENRLSEKHASQAAVLADAKENLNAIRQETNAAVTTADRNVIEATRTLDRAKEQHIRATENKVNMDNNSKASHEQRAVADARLASAKQDVQKAQSNLDTAKKEQEAAQKNQKDKMMEAQKEVNDAKGALDKTTVNMQANSRGQKVENAKIMQARENEDRFRNMAQSYGMGNRGYNNAADFQRQRIVDGQKRALANYKNFDSSNFRNVLSPEERSQFQRQRELTLSRNKKLEMARNIATGRVKDAWDTADTMSGKVGGAAGAIGGKLVGKTVQTAAKTAAFGAGAVVGSFGGVGGAAIMGGMAANLAGKNTGAVDFVVTEAQAKDVKNKASNEKESVQITTTREKTTNKVSHQYKVQKSKSVANSKVAQETSTDIITRNAENGRVDPDISNIIK